MPRESQAARTDRAARIVTALRRCYPDARCALDYRNPLELLVATILSAQCTDTRVNAVTKDLFATYRTAADFAAADPEALQEAIRSTGFFRNKAKSIIAAAARIQEAFGGEVPRTMDALLTLPGVARKTANVVLTNAYGIQAGVVVDTHVSRLAQRLRLTQETTPEKIERDLMKLLPQHDWGDASHLLIFHGRNCCTARKPACAACSIRTDCPSAFTFKPNTGGKT